MREYMSTFTTGFSSVAEEQLQRLLPGVKICEVYDGMIRYRYAGNPHVLHNLPFVNNTFAVLGFFREAPSFAQMVALMEKKEQRYPIDQGTFRVRFVRGNQFAGVEASLMNRAEKMVKKNSRLKEDRLKPRSEVWYVIRNDGTAFYGQLLHLRKVTEKKLNKGELRPELAYLLCAVLRPRAHAVLMDPFCGYGGIVRQMLKYFEPSRILASDLDPAMIEGLKETSIAFHDKVRLSCMDARDLTAVHPGSVDGIVTDPPWGFYDASVSVPELYRGMLAQFRRVLVRNGRAVVLTAAKEELAQAARAEGAVIERTLNTLVNGKKAGVFVLRFA